MASSDQYKGSFEEDSGSQMRWCFSSGLTEDAADEELGAKSFDAESSSVSIEEENRRLLLRSFARDDKQQADRLENPASILPRFLATLRHCTAWVRKLRYRVLDTAVLMVTYCMLLIDGSCLQQLQ